MKRNRRSREGETYLIVLRRFSLIEFAGVVAYFVVLFLLSHLQYYHFRLRSVIYPLMWFSVAFVLYKVLFERSRERRGVLQLGGIIGFFVLLYYLIPLTGFCRYTDYGWFYVNEKDPTITIASRGYSCFMTVSIHFIFSCFFFFSCCVC